jgi:hypothetical protein
MFLQVLNVFLNKLPIAPHFIPYSFAINFTLVSYIIGGVTIYLFWDCPKLDLNLNLFFVMGQSMMPITKEKNFELGGPHNLINMSHTKLWSQVTLYNGH